MHQYCTYGAMLLVVALCLLGCEGDNSQNTSDPAPADVGLDVEVCEQAPDVRETQAMDSALEEDSASFEADTSTTEQREATEIPFARVFLHDGESVEGELVATVNHNYWWDNSAPEMTFALFNVEDYAPFPDDKSMKFVSSRDVRAVHAVKAGKSRVSYRSALRSRDLVLERVPLDGKVHVITGHDSYHLEENGYGDFAWDLVVTEDGGARYTGDGTENSDFYVWDSPVYLPSTGVVVEVVRSSPDNEPGRYKPGSSSNYVGVHIGGSYYVYVLHMRQDTIPEEIKVGDVLFEGAYIGRVGNSGVTLEPHLHMTAFWYDEDATPARYWSIPMEFASIFVASSPIGPAVHHDYIDPPTRSWISREPFR